MLTFFWHIVSISCIFFSLRLRIYVLGIFFLRLQSVSSKVSFLVCCCLVWFGSPCFMLETCPWCQLTFLYWSQEWNSWLGGLRAQKGLVNFGARYRAIGHSQFSSVVQSCLTLCDPLDWSTPGLPVHHQLLEPTQTHVHCIGDAIQPSHPLPSPSPPALNLS